LARAPLDSRRRLSAPIVWVALCLAIGIIVVLTTHAGLDILALLVAAFVLLLLERTVGDWLAETLGPAPAALVFVIVAVAGLLYVTTERGQAQVDRVFDAAADRGYRTTYFRLNRRPASSSPPSAAVPPGSVHAVVPTLRPPTAAPGGAAAGNSAVGPAGGVRIARLRVTPEVTTPGTPVVFRADLSAERPGTLPAVVFSVDGRVVATVTPDAGGAAETRWQTAVPGQYVIRARIPGRLFDVALASTVLNVLPRRR
jgi:hypothetical protein